MTLDPPALTRAEIEAAEQEAIDNAWAATVARRLDDLVSGRVKGVSFDETTRIAQERLEARRRH